LTKTTSKTKTKATNKKKTPKKYYFTKDTEEAIIQYCATECTKIRTRLYIEHIQPAFNELVDKIVYTYKFTSLENIDPLKDECKIWLTTILAKFNPNKGTKAFSYFSVVTKNWFTHKAKKQTLRNRRETDYDSMIREIEIASVNKEPTFIEEQIDRQYWEFLLTEVESWQSMYLKENEQKVLDAILVLMSNLEQIEIFNKKAVYLYMREITGLNTKQIVGCLNKMRVRYRNFKEKWDNGEIN